MVVYSLKENTNVSCTLLLLFNSEENWMIDPKDAPPETVHVMATCHALVQLDDEMVGDPLEKATLKAVEYTLTKGTLLKLEIFVLI